jgi:hypothetical protein
MTRVVVGNEAPKTRRLGHSGRRRRVVLGTVGAEDASTRLWDCGDDVEIEIEMGVRARGSLATLHSGASRVYSGRRKTQNSAPACVNR